MKWQGQKGSGPLQETALEHVCEAIIPKYEGCQEGKMLNKCQMKQRGSGEKWGKATEGSPR